MKLAHRVRLGLVCDERRGHEFHIRIEGSSGETALIGGDTVLMPWLRAACSCGWVAEPEDIFTIEENAHWAWLQHIDAEA